VSVDWERYQKCPVCGAPLGTSCMTLSGTVVGGRAVDVREAERDRPHSTRKLRAAAARAVGRG
jgi:hypothetical protein